MMALTLAPDYRFLPRVPSTITQRRPIILVEEEAWEGVGLKSRNNWPFASQNPDAEGAPWCAHDIAREATGGGREKRSDENPKRDWLAA